MVSSTLPSEIDPTQIGAVENGMGKHSVTEVAGIE